MKYGINKQKKQKFVKSGKTILTNTTDAKAACASPRWGATFGCTLRSEKFYVGPNSKIS